MFYLNLGELGDYDPEIHQGNYVALHKLFLKQTDAIEEKIIEVHSKSLKSQTPSKVESSFLRLASQLETYGVDPHSVKVTNYNNHLRKHTLWIDCF